MSVLVRSTIANITTNRRQHEEHERISITVHQKSPIPGAYIFVSRHSPTVFVSRDEKIITTQTKQHHQSRIEYCEDKKEINLPH